MRRSYVGLLAALCVGCTDGKDDAETAGPLCPSSVESFCAYQFGGACPSFAEVSGMTCNGYVFSGDGSGSEPMLITSGHNECPYPSIACGSELDTDYRTHVFFADDAAGTVVAVDLRWDDHPECPMRVVFGDPGC